MSKYANAGVSIASNDTFVDIIKDIVKGTYYPFEHRIVQGVGGFCALYRIPNSYLILASSTDGVGTKALIASEISSFYDISTIGQDLVAMVMNDVITSGATPLFLLDYFGLGHIKLDNNYSFSASIIRGIADGCKLARCAFIGGETAEMRDMYPDGKFDLAGFGVGMIDQTHSDHTKGDHQVSPGDQIIGIASSGPHSNGFSLIRSIYANEPWEYSYSLPALMEPTYIYVDVVSHLCAYNNCAVHAMAHITGGGLRYNISRVIPTGYNFNIDWNAWERPYIFKEIQQRGKVSEAEMQTVFNCGIGYAIICDKNYTNQLLDKIHTVGYDAWVIGDVNSSEL